MSVGGIRLPGLSTGMDTDQMIKDMLTGEKNKVDKAKQEKDKITWQQNIYREIIDEVSSLKEKYFDVLSPNYILGGNSLSTTTITSSNSGVISATGDSTSGNIDYKFEVGSIAKPPSKTSSVASNGVSITKDAKLSDLGLTGDVKFKVGLGVDKDGKAIESGEITLSEDMTITDLMSQVKDATGGKVRVNYSEMTGTLSIESTVTGTDSKLSIINSDGSGDDALSFLGIDGKETEGSNANVVIKDVDGNVIKTQESQKNSFTIDGITYNINGVGSADLKGTTDTAKAVDTMKDFVKEYNAIVDKVYNLVTEKANKDYPPLTEEQRKDMSEEEIKRWEDKAKQGILRNDDEMRRFLNDLEKAMGSDLSKIGIRPVDDYNKRGQIALDEVKFAEALQSDSKGVKEALSDTLAKTSKVIDNYVGSSSAVFIKKAGRPKSATVVNNVLSKQIREQEEKISLLNRKYSDKENSLYAKFALLESNMAKLNSQMTYLMQG